MGLIKKFKEAKTRKRAEKEKQAKFDAEFPPFMRSMTVNDTSGSYSNTRAFYEAKRLITAEGPRYELYSDQKSTLNFHDHERLHLGDKAIFTKDEAIDLIEKWERANA